MNGIEIISRPVDVPNTLHLLVQGCEVVATFSEADNKNTYSMVKGMLIESCIKKMCNNQAKTDENRQDF